MYNIMRVESSPNLFSRVHDDKCVGVFFEYIPKETVNGKGAKTVWVRGGGKDKERATVILLDDSSGAKYPPWVVFKAAKPTAEGGDEEN